MSNVDAGGEDNIPELLEAVDRGDPAALDRLVDAVYPELKRLARIHLSSERPGHTLNTTAIVHEAYERISMGAGKWNDRRHFLRAASTVMRHLLVDYARKRRAEKRGSGLEPLSLHEARIPTDDDGLAVLALNNALEDIAALDPRLEQVVECRYFAGLSVTDTAEALGLSVRTVERDLQRAKAYLLEAMNPAAD